MQGHGGPVPEWLGESTDLDRAVALDDILRGVVDEVTAKLGADRGTLYLLDHARGELVSRVAHLPEIAEIRLRIGEGVAGRVASTGHAIKLPSGDGRFATRVDDRTGYETRNMVAVPVVHDGTVVAVLQLLNRNDGEFSDEDVELLGALAGRVSGLLDRTSLAGQLRPGQRQPLAFRFNHIVGDSSAMHAVYDRTWKAARTDATVLIRGESGSGKGLVARAIHDNSARSGGAFVKVDCAALPEQLVENELFGHERGAYTGAGESAGGKVDAAAGGTLFLDEIGELPLNVQARLLRLLQDRDFLRVGGTQPIKADVRFVGATHVDLEAAVDAGRFRQDLYYRLRVVEVRLPALRERGAADLDRLIDHMLFRFSRRHGRPDLALSAAGRAALHAHDWPGNVRELEHCIESAVVLTEGDLLRRTELSIRSPRGLPGRFSAPLVSLRELERLYVHHVVEHCGGNRSEAARLLRIGRNTLLRKLTSDVDT
ncbi:MAG: sigma-54-dependent Fis family transcriptional regulator [Proteobacteria bacterium]|nr:sigma-54-dependent Fis family transcriptional regulator [Pseudomonadota bacterium]MCP4917908.1 sigma-54-dependent Fis family transcriptional regulator [Pseudomonadota bacterium]